MIQELLGGSKLSVTTVLEGTPASTTPSPSPSSSSSSSSSTMSTSSSTSENLRCPRCDSSNTKFCYYNNYNLTQPRHFCKACRRYWTKGGALRNVPIGGGCRKNKSTTIATCIAKSSTAKLKSTLTSSTSDIGKSGFIFGLERELSSNPILWSSSLQNSITHPLSFLRSNRNPNNPSQPPAISNPISVKDEGFLLGLSHISTGSTVAAGGTFDGKTLGLSTLSQASPVGFCSSYWRNNQQQAQQNQASTHQSGYVLGETQNYTGLQELYQRLRSSTNYYYPDQATVMLSNVASSSSSTLSTSTILESSPVAAVGEVGLWSNHLPWSDLPSTSGALP